VELETIQVDKEELAVGMATQRITGVKLAEVVGISYPTLMNIKAGHTCKIETAQRIADALNMPLDKLLVRAKDANPTDRQVK
jgi:DNA-binding Xre family transcriptional regulator